MNYKISKLSWIFVLTLILALGSGCNLNQINDSAFSDDETSIIASDQTPTKSQTQSQTQELTPTEGAIEYLSQEQLNKIAAYIEYISLYEEIKPFTSIEVIDYNWLVSRFFYMAPTIPFEELDEKYEGRIAATLEDVEEIVKTHVNPKIKLPTNFDYNLDETLVIWIQNDQNFAWYGRGLPIIRHLVYPIEAYKDSNNAIVFRAIDLNTITRETLEDNAILDVYDKDGNLVGTYDELSNIYELSVDISELTVSEYHLINNGTDDYFLISKLINQ